MGLIHKKKLEAENIFVPDHDGGRPKEINAWFLYTHMVYL
jgi:hypothetical protein